MGWKGKKIEEKRKSGFPWGKNERKIKKETSIDEGEKPRQEQGIKNITVWKEGEKKTGPAQGTEKVQQLRKKKKWRSAGSSEKKKN